MGLLYLSWFFLLVLGACIATPAPAANDESSSSASDTQPELEEVPGVADTGSPQFLYMQMLHDRLKDSKQNVPQNKANQQGGSLLATSIEADTVTGPGNVEDGFAFQEGNTFNIMFTVPRQKDSTTIQNAELWLFPSQQYQATFEKGTVIEMTLLVVINLAHAKQPRREVMEVTWNTHTDCIPLSMTSLSRKISKNLQKRDLEQANITVSIEVVRVNSQASQLTIPINSSFDDICTALADKTSNTPFFVVKYYSDEPFGDYISSGSPLDLQPPVGNNRQKKDIDPSDSSRPSNCSVVPLIVDLAEVYGPFIIKPQRLDISDCYGSCNVLLNYESFSQHATILERLKLVKGGDVKREVGCVPIAYKSQDLLIYQWRYYVLVEFRDMIVTECACH